MSVYLEECGRCGSIWVYMGVCGCMWVSVSVCTVYLGACGCMCMCCEWVVVSVCYWLSVCIWVIVGGYECMSVDVDAHIYMN